jgi:gliding motility-associated-like protein
MMSLIRIFTGLLVLLSFCEVNGQAFVTNGAASSLGGDCYQITPDAPGQTGNIFSQNPINLTQPFYEEATFFYGCKDANGADGIVFILATTNTITGTGGGGLGYEGITPSIAIEYDDYFNGNYADPTADHVAVVSMGSVNHGASTGLVAPIDLPNIEDCEEHCFAVAWDPVSMRLSAVMDDEEIAYTGDIINSIFAGNPVVYYGFSSGTGSLSNIHRVCFGPPLLDPLEDQTICEGESAFLQADENGVTWTWEPDPTLSALNISDPEASPSVTTEYRVFIEYACGFFRNDTVIVNVLPLPELVADNNGPLCEGYNLSLTVTGGASYEWDGPDNFFSTQQNPSIFNITIDQAGLYSVTVTDAAGCTSTAETEVIVDTGPEITIDPPPSPICDNHDPIQFTADPPGGTWDGEIDEDGLFDPAFAGEGIHTISYTVTNAIGCSNTEEIDVLVYAAPEVLIDPPGTLCETSAPVQLTGSPSGGVWIGEVTLGGIFDPADAGEGFHLITYIAEDANGCTNEADITIEVVPGLIATITPDGPFCTTDSVIVLQADPPGGEWDGDANSNGEIFPADLGPGNYLVTYTYVDQQGCFYGQENISIIDAPDVNINPAPSLCNNALPYTLTASPTGGVWSGAADPGGIIDPVLLGSGTHEVIYTYLDAAGCEGADTSLIIILPAAPVISNLIASCDPTSTIYTVTFAISGGDPASYIVQGSIQGTLIPGNPAIFISDSIPSGSPYTFWVDDANHCDPDTVTGSELCNCTTNAGNMDLAGLTACDGDVITVLPPTGVVLDADDSLVYVLHLGFPANIILVSDSLNFAFAPPLQTGVTYFVSSVAGNAMPGLGVDLNDPCLSVSFGTPVMWVAEPAGTISGPSALCEGSSAQLTFNLIGTGPFDVSYSDGTNTFFLDDISSGHMISIQPSSATTYTLTQLTETTPPQCSSQPLTSHVVSVFPEYLVPINVAICSGDSLLVGGDYQMTAGMYLDTLTSALGCDSIIQTQLSILPIDTTQLSDTSCDPSMTGVFTAILSGADGCDSVIVTTVTYVLADTTLLSSFTCDEMLAGEFTTPYIGQSGCDSIVIETITYIPPDTTTLNGQTCDPAQAGTFITVMMNDYGCDSFLIEMVQLIPSDTTILSGETCDPADAGMFTTLLTNVGGCDSLVIETISLLPSDTTILTSYTCEVQDTGVTEIILINSFGCDSLIQNVTSLLPLDSCIIPVIHREVYIPNVFSPNGDGVNDYFFISGHPEGIRNIPLLQIYDRWGGLVYERVDALPNLPEQGWDGKARGDDINPGVFVYVAHLVHADGKEEVRTGDVTLVR